MSANLILKWTGNTPRGLAFMFRSLSTHIGNRVKKLSERHPMPSVPLDLKKEELTQVVESKEEFKYAEKIMSVLTVPEPPKHDSYPTPSGWMPPNIEKSSKLPYFVLRTRYHMFPIYPIEREGGTRKLVRIRNIHGDIWKFETDLRNYIQECIKTKNSKELNIYCQVNEVQRQVVIKGHHQEHISKFFQECGF